MDEGSEYRTMGACYILGGNLMILPLWFSLMEIVRVCKSSVCSYQNLRNDVDGRESVRSNDSDASNFVLISWSTRIQCRLYFSRK